MQTKTEPQQRPLRTFEDLRSALVARRHAVGLTQVDMDAITGLADGHVAKIESGARRLGPVSLPILLEALHCDLVLVPRAGRGRS
jgi:predicted transcriptional regulator